MREESWKKRPPHCDEIIHFDSNEFEDGGNPKSLDTLNKLNQLINKEVSIGMGTTTPATAAAVPSPAIGYVSESVPGVPGEPPPYDEIQEILKPIAPPITNALRRALKKSII